MAAAQSHWRIARCVAMAVVTAWTAVECHAGFPAPTRYRLPSSVPQFFGYGNGPGYHAPMVLGVFGGQPTHGVHRQLYPPRTPSYPSVGFSTGPTLIESAPHHAVVSPSMPAAVEYAPQFAPTPMATPEPARRSQPSPRPPVEPRSPSDVPTPEPIPLPN